MKKVEALLVEGVRLTLSNRYMWYGQCAPEEEWTLVYVAPTVDEIIATRAEEIGLSEISYDGATLEEVTYLQYEDYRFVFEVMSIYGWSETSHPELDSSGIFERIKDNPAYLDGREIAQNKRRKKKAEKEEAQAVRTREVELKKLAKLKEKYEDGS